METSQPFQPQVINMPVIPLRDVVVFPHMVIPLFVGREKSIQALQSAIAANKQIFLASQEKATDEEPSPDNIYKLGAVSTVLQMLKLPDGTVKVLVEGSQRGELLQYSQTDPYFRANIMLIEEMAVGSRESEVLTRSLLNSFEQYIKMNKKIPPEVLTTLSGIEDIGRLTDSIAAHMALKIDEKQKILETLDIKKRVEDCIALLEAEIDLMKIEDRITTHVKKQMEKQHRKYYLDQKMEAIQKELGDLEETPGESTDLAKKIEQAGMTKEAKEKALSELQKLKSMPPMSAEATVSRNYLDVLISVPWKKRTAVNQDMENAEKVLNNDHYGLKEVKERILEYLAVQRRVKKLKGPVLCLVGPPGVGKTSLGESIARAVGRKYVRVSLGGIRDEAEIRGHRRTYIGALPGKIIQRMTKVGVKNPLFLLDEIDKMAMDFRGDPASALLEVLDPEQNNNFNDHYLEVDYDLSDVMFVCTANSLNIPAPLQDRMEVIRIPGYTEDEKVNIALKHLLRKQMDMNGLKEGELEIPENIMLEIIRYYCREAGVRNLEREIAKICRRAVRNLTAKNAKQKKIVITHKNLETYLGVKKYRFGTADEEDRIGLVTGLAWTEVGGELLTIEAASLPGKGKAIYTGHLGDIMQESIQAAMTVVRSRHESLGIHPDFFSNHDIHVHVPEGATPKDGPSAGIGMCTALVSAITGIPVHSDIAMTGEITLRGEILPIGGLKEKLLAAHRGGIKTVIIPEENQRELKEIPEMITRHLIIKPMRWIDEVLGLALIRQPQPLSNMPADVPVMVSTPERNGGKSGRKAKDQPRTH